MNEKFYLIKFSKSVHCKKTNLIHYVIAEEGHKWRTLVSYDLLSKIVGSKTKVAVLRIISLQTELAARQIQKKAGKSWGAVKPALDSLQAMGIILVQKGKWSDAISLNQQHLFYELITELFLIENNFFALLGRELYNFAREIKLSPISVFWYLPTNTLYLVCQKSVISQAQKESCLEYLIEHGMPEEEFSFELTQADSFTTIWDKNNSPVDFTLLEGKLFPFGGLQKAYDFFGITNEDNVATASKTGEVVE